MKYMELLDASEMNVKPGNLLKTASFIYNIRPQLCIKRYLMSWLLLNVYAVCQNLFPLLFFKKQNQKKPKFKTSSNAYYST